MALTPGAMQSAPPRQPGMRLPPPPADAPAADRMAYAMENWALYPETLGAPPAAPVIPTGMFPWESPMVRAARHDAGEAPGDPPAGYERVLDAVFGIGPPEPPAEHAAAAQHRPAGAGNARVPAAPAASQH